MSLVLPKKKYCVNTKPYACSFKMLKCHIPANTWGIPNPNPIRQSCSLE